MMSDKATKINSTNCDKVRLDLGRSSVDSGSRDLSGTHEGIIDETESFEEKDGASFRIWVKVKVDGETYRLSRFLPNVRRLAEELNLFDVDLDVTDVSEGLNCSTLIGRGVTAVVDSKPTKDGKTWNWITELTPSLTSKGS